MEKNIAIESKEVKPEDIESKGKEIIEEKVEKKVEKKVVKKPIDYTKPPYGFSKKIYDQMKSIHDNTTQKNNYTNANYGTELRNYKPIFKTDFAYVVIDEASGVDYKPPYDVDYEKIKTMSRYSQLIFGTLERLAKQKKYPELITKIDLLIKDIIKNKEYFKAKLKPSYATDKSFFGTNKNTTKHGFYEETVKYLDEMKTKYEKAAKVQKEAKQEIKKVKSEIKVQGNVIAELGSAAVALKKENEKISQIVDVLKSEVSEKDKVIEVINISKNEVDKELEVTKNDLDKISSTNKELQSENEKTKQEIQEFKKIHDDLQNKIADIFNYFDERKGENLTAEEKQKLESTFTNLNKEYIDNAVTSLKDYIKVLESQEQSENIKAAISEVNEKILELAYGKKEIIGFLSDFNTFVRKYSGLKGGKSAIAIAFSLLFAAIVIFFMGVIANGTVYLIGRSLSPQIKEKVNEVLKSKHGRIAKTLIEKAKSEIDKLHSTTLKQK